MTFAEIERARAPFETAGTVAIERALLDQMEQDAFPEQMDLVDDAPLRMVIEELWGEVIVHFAALAMSETQAMLPARPATGDGEEAAEEDPRLLFAAPFVRRHMPALLRLVRETSQRIIADLRERLSSGALTEVAAARELVEITGVRARRIAQTEVLRTSNYAIIEGAQRVAEEQGVQMEKVWNTTLDGHQRDTHDKANGQRVPIGGMFEVGGHRAEYPGDWSLPAAESINCRCHVTTEPAETKSQTWLDERDERMRAMYWRLREEWGRGSKNQAIAEVAKQSWVALSESQVERIIYKKTRT